MPLPPTLQLLITANAIIAACYLAISVLIFVGLIRQRHLGFNALGTATGFIFFTCSLGHFVHAEHYWEGAAVYASGAVDISHQALADGITIVPAILYLTLRRRYGFIIRGPHALLDFQRRLELAEALRVVSQDVTARTDLEDLLRRVAEHGRTLLGADYAAVAALDARGRPCLQVSGSVSGIADEDPWRAAAFAPGTPPGDAALAGGAPLVAEDLAALPGRTPALGDVHAAEGGRSLIAVPLRGDGRAIGSLMVAYRTRQRLGRELVAGAEALAAHAAIALENARLIAGLREAERLKGEFLSVAAHELKTPVTSLRGFAQVTMRQLGGQGAPDPSRLARALEVIDRQSVKLTALVGQLLDVSRIEMGHLTLDRAEADVVEIVDGVVASARLDDPEHEIAVTAPPALPASVDALRLEQVLTNLIGNARKFSPPGTRIDVVVEPRGPDRFSIAVRDRGAGVPPEHRAHIFERAYQVNDGSHSGGLGLGLYISRQIVELHGGTIEPEFPPDGGTRMVVTLPVRPAPARQPLAATA
jgi:signal transduction histidine kinase